ncbi:MAG: polymerase sigma factor, sigma-70 family [Planctomycetaceae bacterium]|nr:polymerase sigma factor, sigma-70 family [Planctomycetaceae bacterium]
MEPFPDTRRSLLVRLREPTDDAAWAEFIGIYDPLVYRLARRRGFQDADARDLCQEVLRTVARAIDQWDPNPEFGTFRGWLFRIARNLMLNYLTAQKRHPKGTGDTDFQKLLEAKPISDPDDSALFDLEYKKIVFQRAADSIRHEFTDSTWQAFWLTGIDNLEVKQVSEQLQISPGAVYIARSRVLARLKERVKEMEGCREGSSL